MHYTRYHCMFQNQLFGGTAMTTIYLIRHAEAEGNLYRIAQGQHESILTDRGWRQVQALERRFEGVHIDAVYTSDLYRTCATASAICRPRDLKPIRRKDLRRSAWETGNSAPGARSIAGRRRRWRISARTPSGGMWKARRRPPRCPGADAGRPAGDCRGK